MFKGSFFSAVLFLFLCLSLLPAQTQAFEVASPHSRCSLLIGHYEGDHKWRIYGPYHHKIQDPEAHQIPEKCVDQAVGLLHSKQKLSEKKILWTDNEIYINRVTFGYGGSTRTFSTEAFNRYSLVGQVIPIQYRRSDQEVFDAPVPWNHTPWDAWGIPLFSWVKFKEHRWSDCQISPSKSEEYEPMIDELDLNAVSLAGLGLDDCVRMAIRRMDKVNAQGSIALRANQGYSLVAKIQVLSPEVHPSYSIGFLYKDQTRNAWVIGQLAWIPAP